MLPGSPRLWCASLSLNPPAATHGGCCSGMKGWKKPSVKLQRALNPPLQGEWSLMPANSFPFHLSCFYQWIHNDGCTLTEVVFCNGWPVLTFTQTKILVTLWCLAISKSFTAPGIKIKSIHFKVTQCNQEEEEEKHPSSKIVKNVARCHWKRKVSWGCCPFRSQQCFNKTFQNISQTVFWNGFKFCVEWWSWKQSNLSYRVSYTAHCARTKCGCQLGSHT